MTTTMNLLEPHYETMRARGLTRSGRDFSERVLHKSATYYAMVRNGSIPAVSVDALAHLLVHLNRCCEFDLAGAVYSDMCREIAKAAQ